MNNKKIIMLRIFVIITIILVATIIIKKTQNNSTKKISEEVLKEDMYDSETIIYTVKSCNKDNINVTKAQVSNTEMKLELTTKWGDPVFTENDSEEEKERKKEEFFNKTHSVENILIKNEYIENEKGERFYPIINSSDANGGYNQMFDGTLRYWQTFNLTQYNTTDTLKVVLEKQGQIVEIILSRKN